MNKKNSKGLTALDIFYVRRCQGLVDAAVGDILLAANAKTARQLHRPSLRDAKRTLLVEYFSGLTVFRKNSEKILAWLPKS